MIAEQTRQPAMGNGVMWRLKGNGLKIDLFLEQAQVQNYSCQKYSLLYINLGEINLRPDTGQIGGELIKGNVYFDDQPVCDDGWGIEEATVACRWV